MKTSNVMIALSSAVAGGLLVALLSGMPEGAVSTSKSDRLGGAATETAFLPERFGVRSSQQ